MDLGVQTEGIEPNYHKLYTKSSINECEDIAFLMDVLWGLIYGIDLFVSTLGGIIALRFYRF